MSALDNFWKSTQLIVDTGRKFESTLQAHEAILKERDQLIEELKVLRARQFDDAQKNLGQVENEREKAAELLKLLEESRSTQNRDRQQIQKMNDDLQKSAKQIFELQNESQRLRGDSAIRKNLVSMLAESEKNIQEFKDALNDERRRNMELVEANKQSDAVVRELQKNIKAMSALNEKLKTDTVLLDRTVRDLRNALNQRDTELKARYSELTQQKAQILTLQSPRSNPEQQAKIEYLEKENQKLRGELDTLRVEAVKNAHAVAAKQAEAPKSSVDDRQVQEALWQELIEAQNSGAEARKEASRLKAMIENCKVAIPPPAPKALRQQQDRKDITPTLGSNSKTESV